MFYVNKNSNNDGCDKKESMNLEKSGKEGELSDVSLK
jgi:hypothetical protein